MDIEIPKCLKEYCESVGKSECANPFQVEPEQAVEPAELEAQREELLRLKRELRVTILAHNYQRPEVQDVADYVGDSLGLSREAAKMASNDPILFCGVDFMGEVAKILNPQREVLLPDLSAGCSLEECCRAEDLAKFKAEHPELYVVSYINCSAAVKALSDVICTSGNADRIVSNVPQEKRILFVPDENLGSWVREQTHREMVLWPGYCYLHTQFTPKEVEEARRLHPQAKVIAHPECLASVKAVSDAVCSTEKMIHYCRQPELKEFIVVTEMNMIHRLKKECPGKTFYPLNVRGYCPECKHMKRNTLAKMIKTLKGRFPRIELPKEIMEKARIPIERMLNQ